MNTRYCMGCMAPLNADGTCPNGCGDVAPNEAHMLPQGTLLQNRYLIGRSLGQGGFGITYIGRDLTLDIPVAIKEYFPEGAVCRGRDLNSVRPLSSTRQEDLEAQCDRYLEEARSLARFLGQPGVVEVRDYFRSNGTAYIVTEYLEGETLAACLHRRGRLSLEETLSLLDPILGALEKIHAAGLIHRDISPDNIMLTKDGARLLDFGRCAAPSRRTGAAPWCSSRATPRRNNTAAGAFRVPGQTSTVSAPPSTAA